MMISPSSLPTGMHVFERGWLSANNILFTGGHKTLLVDSGYCTHSIQTLSLVEQVLGDQPLDILVNTHLHSDHCGGNATLQARYPAIHTLIPPGQAQYVRDWNPVALTYSPTGQLCPQFACNKTLVPGTSMQMGANLWEIHAAPGHDPHSVIFFEPCHRVLISADALWEKGFGVVFPELDGDKAFDEVSATLDIIERLNPLIVIPGHGPVFGYAATVMDISRQRLDAFIKHPVKHARHAAKVLLKFKLLEVQRQARTEFIKWAMRTPYLVGIHKKFFLDEAPLSQWIHALCEDLIKTGVAKADGPSIINI